MCRNKNNVFKDNARNGEGTYTLKNRQPFYGLSEILFCLL